MLVKDQMTPDPICGYLNMPVVEAQRVMEENHIRHLPILDEDKKLVGLVTLRSLMNAVPSDVSQFSPFVVNYILSKLQVHNIMVRELISTTPDTTIEEAARVMADRKIGCLPVMQGEELIGIISDNDLFKIMVELLGSRREGIRVTVEQPDRAGEVARLTKAIADQDGYLSVFVTYPTDDPKIWSSVFKVINVPDDVLVETISKLPDIEIKDVRRVKANMV